MTNLLLSKKRQDKNHQNDKKLLKINRFKKPLKQNP